MEQETVTIGTVRGLGMNPDVRGTKAYVAGYDYRGTVQGDAARLYYGYTYLEPVYEPFDILTADPDRLHWASEYPRRVSKPSPPNLQVVELADYVVRFGAMDDYGMSLVQLWMQPNKYTAAREPLLVCELHMADWLLDVGCAEAERRAFVKPRMLAGGKRN